MPATPQIVRASECSFADLATALVRGFEGQNPQPMTPQAMEKRVSDQDMVLDGSFVLLGEDGPAGLALMGIRGERAWCGELGVATIYRGQGYGRVLLERLIEEARARKLTQMWLEVLTHNTPAFQLYQSLGFRIERELTTYAGPLAQEVARRAFTGPLILPDLSDAGDAGEEVPGAERQPVPIDVKVALEHFDALLVDRPSWEFERVVLERWAAAGQLQALAIAGEEEGAGPDAHLLAGVRGSEVWLVGFGARPGADAAGGLELATALLSALAQQHAGAVFHAAEVPPGDPRGPVLEAAGCPVTSHFFEMVLAL
jgi:GNAT superfamily N-acetyltransferase